MTQRLRNEPRFAAPRRHRRAVGAPGGRRLALALTLALLRRVKAPELLAGLHVLFVGRGEAARLSELIRATQQRSVLVVTEIEGGLRHGSVINLILVDGRVRFEVALDAAEKSGLKLSSRLLALAQSVRPGSR